MRQRQAETVLFSMGRPLAPFYGGLMRLRAALYARGAGLRSRRLPAMVVSVGNLTMGGTGKTPLVMYVCRYLLGMGRRPAVVSRGYRGRARERVNLISDGQQLLLPAAEAGDEPALLAGSLPGVPVLTGPDRYQVGRAAIDRYGVDTVVLDDGFQHLRLARDLDLVLFSARRLLGNGRVFPGGPLREPVPALGRAHGFVITGVDSQNRQEVASFTRFLKERFPAIPVFLGEYLPVCLLHNQQRKTFAMDKARRLPLFAFAGIADPDSFRATLRREDFLITGFAGFADHHAYTAVDLDRLLAAARARRARGLITTEKDFVKLKPFSTDLPILALRVELFMEEAFDLFLTDHLTRLAGAA